MCGVYGIYDLLLPVPIGRNKLSKAVADICKECGIMGYKTNHSLRATAATRLYESGIDEQLVKGIVALRE